MNKLCFALLLTLPCLSLLLALHAVKEIPARVDDGGHLLRMRSEGNGSPTVVLEIGLHGPLEVWAAVQADAASFTRVVSYDWIGSENGEAVLDGDEVARQLHAALVNAKVSPPYVLVGQSFGGIFIRIFASLYPNEVVGLVLLDPTQEQFLDWMEVHRPKDSLSRQTRSGWVDGPAILATLDQIRSSPPLPDVPVIVVTGARRAPRPPDEEVFAAWTAAHDEWVKQLPQGRHVITHQSGHAVQIEQPDLVVDLIREVVEKACKRSTGHQISPDVAEAGANHE
jgi:pimeloyl-ACP methyl ester carboxylesterase